MENQDRVIGLDIGETSIGWAVIDYIDKCIVDMGVRCWSKSEDRLGKPLSRGRREARGRRRTTRRKAHRKQRVKNTLIKYNILTRDQLENLFRTNLEKDIYTLRVEGLNTLLTNEEISRILIRLSKNRGFKSNRKSDKEAEGILNDAISQNEKIMKEKGYRTAGEMLLLDEKFKYQKRNSEGNYKAAVSRKLIEKELRIILEKQQELGNRHITDEFVNEIIKIIIEQRPFATGEDITKLVGNCTFEDEQRSPKATYSFSEFQVRQALNNLRLLKDKKEIVELTTEQKEKVHEKIFSGSGKYTYAQVRKLLKLEELLLFKGLNYRNDIKETEKEVFVNIEEFQKIKNSLKEFKLSNDDLDSIGVILSYYKTDDDIKTELSKNAFPNKVIEEVLRINIKSCKPCHLSLTALKKINVGLKEGFTYNKACEIAGYNFKVENNEEKKSYTLEQKIPMENITNSTVRKALIESRKLLNEIINKYGSPTSIHIELTRDIAKSEKAKKKIHKQQKEIEILKSSIVEEIKKDRPNVELTSTQILKLRLWKEQYGRCMYSNKVIDLVDVLFDDNLCQIDHILPYSRSFDNSYNNKVLVLASENQEKGNKTPYEAFDESKWYEFEIRVNISKNIPYRKKLNLLNTTFRDDEKGFLSRNLNNTSYITTFFSKYIRENLKFAVSDKKNNVICVNGQVTSDVRYLLGLQKDRGIDTHHAVDAAIVAVIDDNFIQKISKYYKSKEENKYKDKRQGIKFPRPWDNFEYEVGNRANKIFISKSEQIKYTGSAHSETIYSYLGKDDDGYDIIGEKVSVEKLSINKDGEIIAGKAGKLDKSNPLYKVIEEAIINGKDLKNLKTPSQGGNPNPVKRVMVYRRAGSGNLTILKDGKSAKINGDMCRVDIFEREGKYYCVPIYVSDTVSHTLPNKAVKLRKPRNEWIYMDENYEFKCSISKSSLVKFTIDENGDKKEYLGYAVPKFDVDSIRLAITNQDGRLFDDGEKEKRFSVGKLKNIQKYKVDLLGNIEKINQEERKNIR